MVSPVANWLLIYRLGWGLDGAALAVDTVQVSLAGIPSPVNMLASCLGSCLGSCRSAHCAPIRAAPGLQAGRPHGSDRSPPPSIPRRPRWQGCWPRTSACAAGCSATRSGARGTASAARRSAVGAATSRSRCPAWSCCAASGGPTKQVGPGLAAGGARLGVLNRLERLPSQLRQQGREHLKGREKGHHVSTCAAPGTDTWACAACAVVPLAQWSS